MSMYLSKQSKQKRQGIQDQQEADRLNQMLQDNSVVANPEDAFSLISNTSVPDVSGTNNIFNIPSPQSPMSNTEVNPDFGGISDILKNLPSKPASQTQVNPDFGGVFDLLKPKKTFNMMDELVVDQEVFGARPAPAAESKPAVGEKTGTSFEEKEEQVFAPVKQDISDVLKSFSSGSSIKDAQAERARLTRNALLADAATQIGAGIAGAKYTPGQFDKQLQLANMPVQEVEEERAAKRAEMQDAMSALNLKKAESEMMNDSAKSDPNSEVSKAQRLMLKKLAADMNNPALAAQITDKMTAKQLEQAFGGVNINNLWTSFMAQEGRKESAAMRAALAGEKSAEKKKTQNFDFLDKQEKAIFTSPEYKAFNKVEVSVNKIQEIINKPKTSASDIGVLYEFIKGMDPDSAVREGEIGLAQKGLSHLANLEIAMKRFGNNPRVLTDDFIKDIKGYVDVTRKVYQDRVKHRVDIAKVTAKQRGVAEDELYPLDMIAESSVPMQQKDPKIEQFANDNGLSYEQAVQVIEKRKGGK